MSTLTPHGACLLWKPELIWLNAVSDAVLAVAFFATAFVVGLFLWRRRDLMSRGVFGIFAIFVAVCGVTRVLVQHNQNANLRPNDKMLRSVCMSCHGLGFSMDALADPEMRRRNFNGRPGRHVTSLEMAEKRLKKAGE